MLGRRDRRFFHSDLHLDRRRRAGLGICFVLGAMALLAESSRAAEGAGSDPRPSILLVVLDTVRADAVSSYGKIEGTTPAFDGLAAQGIRYSQAFSAAPWTLPSHATIFTGRRIDEHQVAMPGHRVLTDEFETLAQLFHEAGYETAAFSENAVVSDPFQLLRGFDVRVAASMHMDLAENFREKSIDAPAVFEKWIRTRDSRRPFFAFVNILDAHRPYEIRAQNPWVPPGTPRQSILDRHPNPERLICGGLPTAEQIQIQRGLYLGDVHAADQKLGSILESARRAGRAGRLITIVTADHGEHFGENQLMGHEFSLHGALLHVPLVVHGVEAAAAKVVDTPVGLEDLMPSLLGWADIAVPDGLQGSSLPLASTANAVSARSFFSAFTDRFAAVPPNLDGHVVAADKVRLRQFCSGPNRVVGGMASLIRYPFKYVWYENYPASLYDLSWDPGEKSDQIQYKKDLAASLEAQMKPLRVAAGVEDDPEATGAVLSEEALEALKQLGYVE